MNDMLKRLILVVVTLLLLSLLIYLLIRREMNKAALQGAVDTLKTLTLLA